MKWSRRLLPFLAVLSLAVFNSHCETLNGTVHLFRAGNPRAVAGQPDTYPSNSNDTRYLYGPWFGTPSAGGASDSPDYIKKNESYTLFFDNAFFNALPDVGNVNEVILVFTFEEGGVSSEDNRLVKIIGPMRRTPDESLASQIGKITFGPKRLEGDSVLVTVQIIEFDAEERENRGSFLDFVGNAAAQFNISDPVTSAEINLAKEIAKTVNDFDQNDEVLTITFELTAADANVRSDQSLPLRTGNYAIIKQDRPGFFDEQARFTSTSYSSMNLGQWILSFPFALVGDVLMILPVGINTAFADVPDGLARHELSYRPATEAESLQALREELAKGTPDLRKFSTRVLRKELQRLKDINETANQDTRENVVKNLAKLADQIVQSATASANFESVVTPVRNVQDYSAFCAKGLAEPIKIDEGWSDAEKKGAELLNMLISVYPCSAEQVRRKSFITTELDQRYGQFDAYFHSLDRVNEYEGFPAFGYPFALVFDILSLPFVGIRQAFDIDPAYEPRLVSDGLNRNDPHVRDIAPDGRPFRDETPIRYEPNTRMLVQGDRLYSNKTWITFSVEKGRDPTLWNVRRRLSESERNIQTLLRERSVREITNASRITDAIKQLESARTAQSESRVARIFGGNRIMVEENTNTNRSHDFTVQLSTGDTLDNACNVIRDGQMTVTERWTCTCKTTEGRTQCTVALKTTTANATNPTWQKSDAGAYFVEVTRKYEVTGSTSNGTTGSSETKRETATDRLQFYVEVTATAQTNTPTKPAEPQKPAAGADNPAPAARPATRRRTTGPTTAPAPRPTAQPSGDPRRP